MRNLAAEKIARDRSYFFDLKTKHSSADITGSSIDTVATSRCFWSFRGWADVDRKLHVAEMFFHAGCGTKKLLENMNSQMMKATITGNGKIWRYFRCLKHPKIPIEVASLTKKYHVEDFEENIPDHITR